LRYLILGGVVALTGGVFGEQFGLDFPKKVYADTAPNMMIQVTDTSTGDSSSSTISANIGDYIVVNGTIIPAPPLAYPDANYSCDQCISITNPYNGTQLGTPVGLSANGTTQWGPVKIPIGCPTFGIQLAHIPSNTVSNTVTITVPTPPPANDAYLLITRALASGQTKIHLPKGNYSVSQQINVGTPTTYTPNIEIYGDGPTTLLRLNDETYSMVFNFVNADNFHIHDLQIDGNRLNNKGWLHFSDEQYMYGINAWNCQNGIIENILAHDIRTTAYNLAKSTGCTILNSQAVSCDANGVSVTNFAGGSGCLVQGVTVDTFSDVGISAWDAIDLQILQNYVRNAILRSSPYFPGGGTHIGIMCEGDSKGTGNKNVTIDHNIIENIPAPGNGFYCAPENPTNDPTNQNENIVFTNNTVSNCQKFMTINHTRGFTCTANTLEGLTDPVRGWGIVIFSDVDQVDIESNLIQGLPTHMAGQIIQISGISGKVIDNTIYTNGNIAIVVKNEEYRPNWVTDPNQIIVGTG
jgi:hypothetical protein